MFSTRRGGATRPHRSYGSLPVVPSFYFEVFTRQVRWPIRRERAAADETEEKEEQEKEEAELKEKDVREKGACGRKGAPQLMLTDSFTRTITYCSLPSVS